MTAPTLEDITEPIPVGVPNHSATADGIPPVEGGEKSRPGVFGRLAGPTPTKRGPGRPRKETAEPKDVPKLGPHFRQKLTDFYILIGGLVMPIDPMAGQTIIDQAPKCGKAVYDYAQENAAFRRAIQGLLQGSLAGALIFAHLPIILVLARHSKREGIRITAASMMVALHMMSDDEAKEAFGDEEKEPENVA